MIDALVGVLFGLSVPIVLRKIRSELQVQLGLHKEIVAYDLGRSYQLWSRHGVVRGRRSRGAHSGPKIKRLGVLSAMDVAL